MLSQTEAFSKGGGLFSGTSVLGLAEDCNTVAGGCMAVGLGAALG